MIDTDAHKAGNTDTNADATRGHGHGHSQAQRQTRHGHACADKDPHTDVDADTGNATDTDTGIGTDTDNDTDNETDTDSMISEHGRRHGHEHRDGHRQGARTRKRGRKRMPVSRGYTVYDKLCHASVKNLLSQPFTRLYYKISSQSFRRIHSVEFIPSKFFRSNSLSRKSTRQNGFRRKCISQTKK